MPDVFLPCLNKDDDDDDNHPSTTGKEESIKLDFDSTCACSSLAGDIALCSWARHLTLTVPLSTQVYK